MPTIEHLDLVVSDLGRSLPFYRELLRPLGWRGQREVAGERGETIHYLWGAGIRGSIGLREKQSDAHPVPYDRYGVGVHHVALMARSRRRVNERAAWLGEQEGVEVLSGPGPFNYTPGYFAVFFRDPDGIKLEIVHRPLWRVPFTRRGRRAQQQ